MLTEKDLQALDQAAALIIGVLERHRIHSEDAAEHRSLFRIIEGDANVLPFPGKQKQPLPDLEEAKILNSDVGIYGATSDDSEQGFVYFTEKEIQTMPKKLKQLITVNRKRCHIRRRPCGSGYTYEIRFRAQGYNLSASGKTKELAKANMLQKMRSASTPEKIHGSTIPTTFNSFAIYYFENYRKRKVGKETYKNDFSRYQKYLAPHFGERQIAKITLLMCQDLIDRIVAQGKFKTAEEIYSLMNVIFTFAVENHIINRKPSDAVLLEPHEPESGSALTKLEEQLLLEGTAKEPLFQIGLAILLYCGLRPNELKTAVIEGEFIKAVNSKRHNKKVEYKLVPIIDRLRPFLANGIPELPTPQLLRRRMKAILPDHRLYDLRTTFHTRCREANVEENALKEFMGHSFGTLGNAYTDFSKSVAYLLKEGKKLNEW